MASKTEASGYQQQPGCAKRVKNSQSGKKLSTRKKRIRAQNTPAKKDRRIYGGGGVGANFFHAEQKEKKKAKQVKKENGSV